MHAPPAAGETARILRVEIDGYAGTFSNFAGTFSNFAGTFSNFAGTFSNFAGRSNSLSRCVTTQ